MRRAAVAIGVAVACFAESPARADDGGVPGVRIAVVGASREAPELGERIASWFRADQVRVAASSAEELVSSDVLASSDERGVRAWIAVLDERRVARVFFTVQARPAEPPRYLVTEVPLEHGLDAIDRERLAQVVYLSSGALWAGNLESSRAEVERALSTAGPAPSPPPASVPPPTAAPLPSTTTITTTTPSKPPSIGVRTGVEYAARWGGDPGLGQAVGANLRVLRGAWPHAFGGVLRAAILVPQSTSADRVGVHTQGMGLGAGAAATRAFGAHTFANVEAGLGVEVVRYRTTLSDPTLRAAPDATDVQPFVSLRAGARHDLGPVGLELQALLAISLERAHYDVEDAGRRTAVIVPWLLQPGVVAGLSW